MATDFQSETAENRKQWNIFKELKEIKSTQNSFSWENIFKNADDG